MSAKCFEALGSRLTFACPAHGSPVADDSTPRLAPADIQALAEAMLRGRAAEVVPDRPPAYATGADAKVLAKVADIQVERAFERAEFLGAREIDLRIQNAIGKFLTEDQIKARIDLLLTERLARIGLQTDEDHIEETGEDVRRSIRWNKRIDKVMSGLIGAGLAAIAAKLLGLIGVNVPFSGGSGN